jgi:metal-dependent amidase/aminoacylase/carboxypeptidase family protein
MGGWVVPERVWTIWRKIVAPVGIRTPDRAARSRVHAVLGYEVIAIRFEIDAIPITTLPGK